MNKLNNIRDFIIWKISNDLKEHKLVEKSKFWINFEIWTKLLYESKNGWFFEGFFLGYIREKSNNWICNYYYKMLNIETWVLEFCPIYNINGYLFK